MISDKAIVDWVDKNGGLTLTRFSSNGKDPTNVRYVCVTGDRFILQKFFNHIYPRIQTKFHLFIIETDWYFLYQEWLDKDNLEKVFAWNKIVNHPKMNALPIGINHKRMFESLSTYCIEEKPKQLLLVNFNVKTNPFRKRLLSLLETKFGNCQSVDFKDYKNEEFIQDKSHIEGTITQQKTTSDYYDILTDEKVIEYTKNCLVEHFYLVKAARYKAPIICKLDRDNLIFKPIYIEDEKFQSKIIKVLRII